MGRAATTPEVAQFRYFGKLRAAIKNPSHRHVLHHMRSGDFKSKCTWLLGTFWAARSWTRGSAGAKRGHGEPFRERKQRIQKII